MNLRRELPVPEGIAGMRVDAGVARLLGLSRTKAADLAQDGQIRQNGATVGKSDLLIDGAWLEVELPDPAENIPTIKPLAVAGMTIRYDDQDLVVVDKPVGIAAHPSIGWNGPTVLGGLAAAGFRIATSGPPERQGIVQRLDVGTSGLMMVAKSERAYSKLKWAFRRREVEKIYHTLVHGHINPPVGTIDAPIGRHPKADYRFAVLADGRASITHYETIETLPGASLLRVNLETGRTHQIRVHMSAMGHGCIGDPMYSPDAAKAKELGLIRQWLHAMELEFIHPSTGEKLRVVSEYPEDLKDALELLRRK